MDEYELNKLLTKINELEAELKGAKKYGLVWDKDDTGEKIVLDCTNNIPILKPIENKNILNGGINNILIKGDNYHSLVALNFILKNSIDLIYIDPPYNTGNKDFIYNDKFIESDDSYRHSKWLSFMERRLILAKELLKDDGLIFASIDDHEQAQLKLLMDKVFGEDNFIACIINQSANSVYGTKATNKNKTYIKVKDYLLVYSKKTVDLNLNPLFQPANSYLHDSHDFIYENGKKMSTTEWFENNYSTLFKKYDLKINKVNIQKLMDFNISFRKEVINKLLDIQFRTVGSFEQDKLNKEQLDAIHRGEIVKFENQLLYAENEDHTSIGTLRPLRESCQIFDGDYLKAEILGDVWNTSSGYQNINAEGGVKFKNGKKPLILLENILQSINKPNALVLDFFAGSGTTGHAVLEQNIKDGGKRKFILCTNNENNIFDDVTHKRFINLSNSNSNIKKFNLRVFETDFIPNDKNNEQAKYTLVEKVDSLLCILEDIYDFIYRNDFYSHYKCGDRHLFIYNDYFNEIKFNTFKEEVLSHDGEKVVYIFSSDDQIFDIELEKTCIVKPIPRKIYEIYCSIVESIKRGE